MDKRLPVWKNTIFNVAGALVYAVCQWLMTVLVVRLSSVEDGGTLSLAMAATNVFFTLATFGLRDYQVSDTGEFSPSEYFSTRLITCAVSSLACAAFVLLSGRYTGRQAACILLYMVYRISEAVCDSLQAMQQKAERMDYSCVSQLLRGLGLLAAFALLLSWTGDLLLAVAGVAAVSCAVVLFWDLRVSGRLAGLTAVLRPGRSAQILRRCYPLMLNSLLLTFMVSFPRDTLERLCGEYALGIYASVAAPTVIVQSAAMWLYAPMIPGYARTYEARDAKAFFRLYLSFAGVIAAAAAAAVLAGKYLGAWGLSLIFPPEVAARADLLVPVLWTTILIALCYYFSAVLTVARRLRVILISNACGALTVLLFARRLIAEHAMEGVNLTIYAGMGINAAIMGVALHAVLLRHFFARGEGQA